MSAPYKISVSHELISAMSAQNTHVTYEGPGWTKDGDPIFISEVEPMIAHSQEHISAAIDMLADLRRDISAIRSIVYVESDRSTYNKVDNILDKLEQKL